MSTIIRSKTQLEREANSDAEELQNKIHDYKKGLINEDKFKHYRLTRGVYGQRQLGVHMFRTKIPFGHVTADQLFRLAEISDQYATGNLHITTRQNIQFHYVKLENAPKIWKLMADVGMNAREACGNTVRNITASANAGIDPEEPFDITPYVTATYHYFMRNPICQEMGRKIKIAFSSSERDSAFTYFHDFGFIPRIKENTHGFKLVIAGGLGAQAMEAFTVSEFIPANEIIPFMEAALRIFDRYGEREKRFKARMKFLIKTLGEEEFLRLIHEELHALENQSIPIDTTIWNAPRPVRAKNLTNKEPLGFNNDSFQIWRNTNVIPTKEEGYYAVNVKVRLGDLSSDQARALSGIVKKYFADDIRFTVYQNILLRYAIAQDLFDIYKALSAIQLADYGAETVLDVTACPGTDTCNLGVTNSTDLAHEIEKHLILHHPKHVNNKEITIKISGCMNSCGQHMAAAIGFHGSSIKVGSNIVPAMQIVLGGGVVNHQSFIAEKIIKIPTKRILTAISRLIKDYEKGAEKGEHFTSYTQRIDKRYFYDLLKDLADKETLIEAEYLDWGQENLYVQAIGVGECAGVAFDMLSAIIRDGEEKVALAELKFDSGYFDEAIYHAYTTFIVGAKALLLLKDIKCNTQIKILEDFQVYYGEIFPFRYEKPFPDYVLRMKDSKPTSAFARQYIYEARLFLNDVKAYRKKEERSEDTLVTESYYKA